MRDTFKRQQRFPQAWAVLGMLLCSSALAQGDASVALERQTDEAFRQLMQQPEDLPRWSRYAQLLVQAGNYEGGIAALERLMQQPDAPAELPLEIAVLYYRLGSYVMAESLIERALADTRLSPAHRSTALALQADVKRRNERSRFSGSAQIGLRHQSNPTYRTGDTQVLAGGTLVTLPAEQRPKSGTDASVSLRAQHLYDLETQNSATVSTNFGVYLDKHRSSSGSTLVANNTRPYNLALLDLNTGIEFKPDPAGMPGLTLRPHVLLANLSAQQHQYLRNTGVGIDVGYRTDERTLAELTVDTQRRRFADRIDVPNARDLNGRMSGIRGRLVRELAPGRVLTTELGYRTNSTDRAFNDLKQYEGRVTYSLAYASPVQALQGM